MDKKLEELKAKRTALLEKSKRADVSSEDLQAILDEVKKINESISLIEEIAKAAVDTGDNSDNGATENDDETGEDSNSSRSATNKRMKPIFNNERRGKDAEVSYREAFRNRVMRNVPIPNEVRAAYVSTTADVGDVIPENLINQIISDSKDVGMIWDLVQHTNYPVGQSIPKSAFSPTVAYCAEGSGSETQKATTSGKIQFSHYKADVRIAWTEETDRMTLEAWESYFVQKVVESITFWKENEIINGTGATHSHVTGILSGTPSYAKVKDVLTYSDLLDMEGNLPAKKDGNSKWFMSKKTFYNTFKSIQDDNGNPVASLNMGIEGKLNPFILGREVIFIDEYIKNHNGAGTVANDITAFMFDMKDYVFNENYDLGVQRRVNWENDDHEMKAVFACDGQPIDMKSLVVLKRATNV